MQKHELTVFIVDDDASVRDALALLFSVRGYRTAVFSGAEDFLSAWKPEWTGCLLIDIRMPGMDGLSLQRRLVELDCTLPVIVITGHGDVESARRAFRANAIDFLEKPIDHDKLLCAIEEGLHFESLSLSRKLAISVRTVEVHKAHIMSKLGVGSVADLVRMSMRGH